MEIPLVPIVIQLSKNQQLQNSCVSNFLGLEPSEQTQRPIYYHWKDLNYKGQTWSALFYVLFYEYNPGYKIAGKSVGYHQGDVERVVILYATDTKRPTWVYFGAHGRGQGIWLPFEKCQFTKDSELIVYVSPSSHGFYPTPRTYLRIGCFANDVCDAKGEQWKPSRVNFESSRTQVWSDTHYQVRPGINSPLNTPDPSEHSITDLERILFCIPFIRKKVQS